jgi:hypothetical protein
VSARTRVAGTAWACAAALVALVGCGGEDPAVSDPTPTSAASTSTSPTGTESGTEAATPSEGASVPVATGPVLRMPSAEVTMPAGWTKFNQLIPATDAARVPKGIGIVTLGEVDSFDDSTNDELARIAMDMSPYAGEIRQEPDVEVDGVPMYHLVNEGRSKSFKNYAYEEFGTVREDQVVKLILELDGKAPESERRAIRDQVLGSFRWR